jgi:uncharacterized membrane protein
LRLRELLLHWSSAWKLGSLYSEPSSCHREAETRERRLRWTSRKGLHDNARPLRRRNVWLGLKMVEISGPRPSRRIVGIDLARFLAIAGMFAVHVGPTALQDPVGRLYAELTHGRASILFGLLAGVGVSLLARSRSATLIETRLRLLWQGALLLPLGLWLQSLDVTILVILAHYAMLFVLGAVCVGFNSRVLGLLAAASILSGPLGFQVGRRHWPQIFDRSAVEWGDPPLAVAHALVLSGPYPLITWAGPILIGMLLGRRDLRATKLRLALVIGGLALAVLAAVASLLLEEVLGSPEGLRDWTRLIDDGPHSQMPPWLLGSIGSALFALGLALIVADRFGRLVWPFIVTGQLALSVYVAHILAFHHFGATLRSPEVGGAIRNVGAALGVAAVFAVLWRRFFQRGPLELVLALPTIAARWWRPGMRPRE